MIFCAQWRDRRVGSVTAMASKIARTRTTRNVNPGVLSWVEELRQVSLAVSKKSSKSPSNRNQLFYILHWTPDGKGLASLCARGAIPRVLMRVVD